MVRELLHSTKIEIITSKRLTAFLYLLTGLAILVWWLGALWQFFYAYIVYEEFDGPVFAFIVINLLFFFPLFFTGCWMLSCVIQRQRILHWIKHSLVITDYQTKLGPATAGILVDYEYNVAEIWGTLLKLHFQGNIDIKPILSGLRLTYINDYKLGSYEKLLLEQILFNRKEIEIHNLRDSNLVNAGLIAHKQLVYDLAKIGVYEMKHYELKNSHRFVKTIYGLAGFTAALQLFGMLFGGDQYWGINYPRYDVSIIQPIILAIATVIGLVIIFSGLRFKFNEDHESKISALLIQSSGFYAYLKNVYGQRMSEKYIETQADNEIRKLAPYIIAYRLQPLTIGYLRKILELTKIR